MPCTFDIYRAIDEYVGDLTLGQDEVCEGLLAVREHLDSYVAVMQPTQEIVDRLPNDPR